MVETLARVESIITVKEVDLVSEYETHQGQPLISNPFWTGCILLARDIQANLQMAMGIREAMTIIRNDQEESLVGFHLLETIASELLSRLGEHPAASPPSPTDSLQQ